MCVQTLVSVVLSRESRRFVRKPVQAAAMKSFLSSLKGRKSRDRPPSESSSSPPPTKSIRRHTPPSTAVSAIDSALQRPASPPPRRPAAQEWPAPPRSSRRVGSLDASPGLPPQVGNLPSRPATASPPGPLSAGLTEHNVASLSPWHQVSRSSALCTFALLTHSVAAAYAGAASICWRHMCEQPPIDR